MPVTNGFSRLARLLLLTAAIVVVVAGLRAFAEPLSAFFLAALIAMVVAPLRNYLMQRGMSQGASLAVVLVLILAVGALLVLFVGVSTNQLIRKLPDYEQQVQSLEAGITTQIERFGLSEQTTEALEAFDLQSLFPIASSILSAVGNSLGNLLLVFLILVYMLLDAPNLPRRLRAVLPPGSRWLEKAGLFINSVQRYMILRTVFGAVIAIIQTIVMLIIGVDFAVQWGVLSLITNYIPNIGFVLGVIPPVAVTLLEKGPLLAVVLLVVYSVVNNIIESFVAPRFMADDLGITSLFIFLSLIFWTWVLGAAGALLAVPLTLLVKIMLLDGEEGTEGVVAVISEKV
ncbi:MAG: AI-2E family transporter [Chloroflexota bacterium]|nr:AI-2E family transporter [Chloroflexota bacterium]